MGGNGGARIDGQQYGGAGVDSEDFGQYPFFELNATRESVRIHSLFLFNEKCQRKSFFFLIRCDSILSSLSHKFEKKTKKKKKKTFSLKPIWVRVNEAPFWCVRHPRKMVVWLSRCIPPTLAFNTPWCAPMQTVGMSRSALCKVLATRPFLLWYASN
jgi:hypothetical protein